MKGRKESTIIKHYLKERLIFLLVYVSIIVVFLVIAGLYEYDDAINNLMYAVIIIAFLGLCTGGFDYINYRNKYKRLVEALGKRGESDYYLPRSSGLLEELYQEMICITEKEKRELIFELDEKKRDMADYYAMWIHQIKTPIAALGLLQQGNTDIRKQESEELFKIEQYAEMALYFARLDNMSSDLFFKNHDICLIIRQAVKKYSVLFIGSKLSFSLAEFSCYAVTDEKWMIFVMEQLISNAIKYTAKGGIRIYGADERGNEKTGEAEYIVIEDTGIGIQAYDLPRIYERGFTGYNGRMSRKSTGIGLYLCKQILDKLSHTIRVESEVDRGTKVIIGFCQE